MSARQWKGTMNGDEIAVQIVTDDDGTRNVWVDRDHKGQDGWNTHQWAVVEERPSATHLIWVAEFEGGDELLINLWSEDDRLAVASRGYFRSSWSAPVTFEETL